LAYVVNQVPNYRVVHLDFKGARPKLSYLRSVLPLMKKAGANAVLVEYEDSFPFTGPLANLSALNSFTESELADFLSFVTNEVNMEVIPLVQTFGHLEYALKLDEFAHLREVDDEPSDLCPSRPEGVDLVKEIVSQVMSYHPDSKYLHIGADEVYNVGRCDKCTERILAKRRAISNKDISDGSLLRKPFSDTAVNRPPAAREQQALYLEHVAEIASKL
jgi:hexosaminidase